MILALGDSHTYGHGLRNCEDPRRDPPSIYAWPYQLKVPVLNCGINGASNAEILVRFLENYQPGKFSGVVILWSFLPRILRRDGQSNLISTNISTNDPFWQEYFTKYYHDTPANNDLLAYVNLVNTLSDVPVLHDFIDCKIDKELISRVPMNLVNEDTFNSFNELWVKRGMQTGYYGNHYNERVHKEWADLYVMPALKRVGVL